MQTSELVMIDWLSIRDLFVSGATPAELSERFGIKAATIAKRASRQKWLSPGKIQARQLEMRKEILSTAKKGETSNIVPDSVLDIAALSWEEKALKHRQVAFQVAHKAILSASDVEMPARDWTDLEKADKMARRAAGLDMESDKTVLNVNLALVNQRLQGYEQLPE
jgi:hypothetical protein